MTKNARRCIAKEMLPGLEEEEDLVSLAGLLWLLSHENGPTSPAAKVWM